MAQQSTCLSYLLERLEKIYVSGRADQGLSAKLRNRVNHKRLMELIAHVLMSANHSHDVRSRAAQKACTELNLAMSCGPADVRSLVPKLTRHDARTEARIAPKVVSRRRNQPLHSRSLIKRSWLRT